MTFSQLPIQAVSFSRLCLPVSSIRYNLELVFLQKDNHPLPATRARNPLLIRF
ncbi:MAG: hypothetical protein IPN20_20155 [Haliscomenobacter sp.]|nr:hypothetical protein [Haliscomenobacter sp.]MBK8656141.1 hypothetical protein [Haliscomenobacter sp.]MBK8656158.1 hypothetical protein [Haliscomenobacter sp.]MBK8656167.1 hypothetical protein [Haliscomenobacter sp.]